MALKPSAIPRRTVQTLKSSKMYNSTVTSTTTLRLDSTTEKVRLDTTASGPDKTSNSTLEPRVTFPRSNQRVSNKKLSSSSVATIAVLSILVFISSAALVPVFIYWRR